MRKLPVGSTQRECEWNRVMDILWARLRPATALIALKARERERENTVCERSRSGCSNRQERLRLSGIECSDWCRNYSRTFTLCLMFDRCLYYLLIKVWNVLICFANLTQASDSFTPDYNSFVMTWSIASLDDSDSALRRSIERTRENSSSRGNSGKQVNACEHIIGYDLANLGFEDFNDRESVKSILWENEFPLPERTKKTYWYRRCCYYWDFVVLSFERNKRNRLSDY